MSTDSTCASMHSSASAQSCDDEHNIWNPILGLCCHYHVNKYFEELLSEEDLGRIARSSRFALDLLCYKGDHSAGASHSPPLAM